MLTLLRTRAAFWAGAGILAMIGAATSLAAAGQGQPAQDPPPDDQSAGVMAEQSVLAEVTLEGDPPAEGAAVGEEVLVEERAVLGVPEDSPACDNVGCAEVENAGGVTLHLPQPAVDGITRAAENREAARNKGDEEDTGDGTAEATAEVSGEEDAGLAEDAVRGVPEDSPACDNVGCGEVENAGGVTLHLPQPAVDGITRAAENRAAAQVKVNANGKGKGNGGGGEETP